MNYKGTHSVVLMAVVWPTYCFDYVDVGDRGKQSDGGTWKACSLGKALNACNLAIPPFRKPPGYTYEVPHIIVADAAFPASASLMRPYPGQGTNRIEKDDRIYNYRHSRARRVVESAFGILSARWRIFRKPMEMKRQQVVDATKACIALHKFLIKTSDCYATLRMIERESETGEIIRGVWWITTASDTGLVRFGGNRTSAVARIIRS